MMLDQAVGSWEAACVMGVHFTRPQRMADEGLLTIRRFDNIAEMTKTDRTFGIYSLRECEQNWQDYKEKQRLSGGRPRVHAHLRTEMLNKLLAVDPKIAFGDAVSAAEAAAVLKVHFSYPAKLAEQGKLVGRVLFNNRHENNRAWIFSRASCEENLAAIRRAEVAGRKRGRRRESESSDEEYLVRKEGRKIVTAAHVVRERDKTIVLAKKRLVYSRNGALACEVCGFDFFARYGDRGRKFAECHHRAPFASSSDERETTVEDLAIVCSNCHRMLHRSPEITVEQLRERLEDASQTDGPPDGAEPRA